MVVLLGGGAVTLARVHFGPAASKITIMSLKAMARVLAMVAWVDV